MKETNLDLLPYRVGGLLYTPAINDGIAEKIVRREYGCLTSMAFCLEDAIMETALEQAEHTLAGTFQKIYEHTENPSELPLLFVRVRDAGHLERVSRKLAAYSEILTGYILPKFDMSNAEAYLRVINGLNQENGRSVYAMPILESAAIADKTARLEELSGIRELLAAAGDTILNIRVGGNDFCNLYGLRRASCQSIYDISVVRDILTDIINMFAKDFVVSAPVWEYFGSDCNAQWAAGLRTELALDRINGFIGKTAVHPAQLPLIYDSLKVSAEDYEDAVSILEWRDESFAVGKSEKGSRMNEVKCHERWARKVKILGDIYGIKEGTA